MGEEGWDRAVGVRDLGRVGEAGGVESGVCGIGGLDVVVLDGLALFAREHIGGRDGVSARPPWHRKLELPARQEPYRYGLGAFLARSRLPGPPMTRRPDMTRFITIPADITPLARSGLELEVWRLTEDLEGAFHTREETPGWFEVPLRDLNQTCELLRVIDWLGTSPPIKFDLEIDTFRAILPRALKSLLQTLHDYRNDSHTCAARRDVARRTAAAIERYLAGVPLLEADAVERERSATPFADQGTAERAIVLQVLRDDHAEQWSRAELRGELHDIEPRAVAAAIDALHDAGAIQLTGDLVCASSCIRRLEGLGMVSV